MKIEQNVSLSQYTTLKTGGVADYFAKVVDEHSLLEAIDFAHNNNLKVLVIGEGSNILAADAGYRGLVIKNEIAGVDFGEQSEQGEAVSLCCGAGETLDRVIENTVERGYWGMENLSSIPGTIGATPVQNVGAYGVEVSSLIFSVEAINLKTKNKKVFTKQECNFSYRDSFFKTKIGADWIITKVNFLLSKKQNKKLEYGELKILKQKSNLTALEVRKKVQEIRSSKFPDWTKVGTAGSFFKNPIISEEKFSEIQSKYPDIPGYNLGDDQVKISLGWVLDHICNLRGYCQDGVCLYENQALVLINKNNSSTAEIKKFVLFVQKEVKNKIGVTIEQEVRNI